MTIYLDYVFYDKLISPINGYECRTINKKNIKYFGFTSIEELKYQYPDFPTQCEEYKLKLSKAIHRNLYVYQSEQFRKKQSDRTKQFYKNPDNRKKLSNRMKRVILDNPDSYSKKNVSGRAKLYELHGLTFKGTWELTFAQFLFDNNIDFIQPESVKYYDFKGNERNYFPDFYIPKYELYIEVKGYERDLDRLKWNSLNKLKIIRSKQINLIRNDRFKEKDLLEDLWVN